MESDPHGPGQSSEARSVHPFFRDVGITLLAQVAFAALSLVLYRLLAQETGTNGFASYSLVKQAVAIVFPVVTVGLVGGLPRYLALPKDDRTPASEAYLLAAVGICGSASALAGGLALAFPDAAAAVFFGNSGRDDLAVAFVALLAANSAYHVTYGYYRGLLKVRTASAFQVGAFALPPPVIVLAFPDESIQTLVLLMALVLSVASLFAIGGPLTRALRRRYRRRTEAAGRELWNYGHRRVPGELAQLGLVVLVPILAAHVATLTDVAYLSAGQQVLSIISLAVVPLGLVLLPSLARMWAVDRRRATGYVAQLVSFAVHVAIFLSFQAILYADIGVRIWLGSNFEDAGSVVRVTVAPAALFAVYLMLRSVLDAVEVRSFNSRNNLIALATFVTLAALFLSLDVMEPVFAVAWAFCAGVAMQGGLTLFTVHRFFGLSASVYLLHVAVPLGLLTGAAGLAARPFIDGSSAELAFLLGLQLALATLYFGTLVLRRAGWVVLLRERFLSRA